LSDYPRRRRLDPEPPKRGGIPIVPLMVLVILGGLLLGGLLTKFFGTGGAQAPTPAPSFTPLPGVSATFAPTFSPTPEATRTHLPKPSPSRAPTATPIPSVTLLPGTTPAPTPKATSRAVHPTVHVTPHSTPAIIILTPTPAAAAAAVAATATPPPLVVAPTATPVLITGTNSTEHAAAIVRAYIASLARGDSSTAAGYLASGLPTESFINPNVSVNVTDLRASRSGDGSFVVTTQIVTSKGTYLASFTLRMGAYGMQITDHSATHI